MAASAKMTACEIRREEIRKRLAMRREVLRAQSMAVSEGDPSLAVITSIPMSMWLAALPAAVVLARKKRVKISQLATGAYVAWKTFCQLQPLINLFLRRRKNTSHYSHD